MADTYEYTPWRDKKELLTIFQWLYYIPTGLLPDRREKACSIVRTWKLLGNLPHAVESTALLTEAVLADNRKVNSAGTIQLAYSGAFCRFVTGLVDSDQTKRHRVSMYEKAKQIGLPSYFVELRHEATHEGLPGLRRLREAVEKSLSWLRHDYWSKLPSPRIFQQDPLLHDLVKLKDIFRTILKKQKAEAMKASNEKSDKKGVPPKWSDTACLELVKICKNEKAMITELAVVLIESGMLVPQGKVLHTPMDDYFPLWDPLIKKVSAHQKHFLLELTDQMTIQMIMPTPMDIANDPYREAVTMWLERIFASKVYATTVIRAKFDYNDILSTCTNCQNHWSLRLGKTITEAPKRDLEKAIYGKQLDKAVHDLENPSEDTVEVEDQPGMWQKWKGKWTPRPFGTIIGR